MEIRRDHPNPDIKALDAILKSWLQERQDLLVLYSTLIKMHPFNDVDFESERDLIQEFCQVLVDYTSVGHFEVFEKIEETLSGASENAKNLDKALLTKIAVTTKTIIDFNESHGEDFDISKINEDLTALMEHLASRMDLEDKLVQSYLTITN